MNIPSEVNTVIQKLQSEGFEAFAVGGCVRDLLLKRKPRDWDVTTNAKPEEIQKLFPKNFYNNAFGTVTVITKSHDTALKHIEVTTYRVDGDYPDQRRPDDVSFTSSLEEDLARRDFTINAMAAAPAGAETQHGHTTVIDGLTIIDPFGGIKDLDARVVRAVGVPAERFQEDALRLLRAVRFAAELDFTIEATTQAAIAEAASSIAAVSHERVRDELIKLVMSNHPEHGFDLLDITDLLTHIAPELGEGIGIDQNKHHVYTVFEHNVKSLQWAAHYNYPLHIRLASLLHDVGKPKTRRYDDKQEDYTFYAHDVVGARMASKLLKRLKFSNELIERVVPLVRHHMFYYDVGKVTEAGARRLLRRVGGPDVFKDLIKVRIAERKGSGVPKAEPYRLRHLQFLVDKASQQPISVGQLAIDGHDLMKELDVKPGPILGGVLNALLAEVLDDPSLNEHDYLLKRAAELKDKDPTELKKLGESAKDEAEKKREDDIKRKYHV